MDVITIVTLDESDNKNKTFRYAGRNAYIKNLFNELNESNLNVVWTSKARPLWVGDNKVPGEYVPDCHDDIPYMVDINVQMKTVRPNAVAPGVVFQGVIGTNKFKPSAVGIAVPDLTWDMLLNLLVGRVGSADSGWCEAESEISRDGGDFAGTITPSAEAEHSEHTPSDPGQVSPRTVVNGSNHREVRRG